MNRSLTDKKTIESIADSIENTPPSSCGGAVYLQTRGSSEGKYPNVGHSKVGQLRASLYSAVRTNDFGKVESTLRELRQEYPSEKAEEIERYFIDLPLNFFTMGSSRLSLDVLVARESRSDYFKSIIAKSLKEKKESAKNRLNEEWATDYATQDLKERGLTGSIGGHVPFSSSGQIQRSESEKYVGAEFSRAKNEGNNALNYEPREAYVGDQIKKQIPKFEQETYIEIIEFMSENHPAHLSILEPPHILALASKYGFSDIVRFLLKRGGDPNVTDYLSNYDDGNLQTLAELKYYNCLAGTPLNFATNFNQEGSVTALLEDKRTIITSMGYDEKTPFARAMEDGSYKIAGKLIRTGKVLDKKTLEGGYSTPPLLMTALGYKGSASAGTSLSHGNLKLSQVIIESGFDVNNDNLLGTSSRPGLTCLEVVLQRGLLPRDWKKVEMLVEAGAVLSDFSYKMCLTNCSKLPRFEPIFKKFLKAYPDKYETNRRNTNEK